MLITNCYLQAKKMRTLTIISIIIIFFSCNNSKKETQIKTEPIQEEIKNERIKLISESDKQERWRR